MKEKGNNKDHSLKVVYKAGNELPGYPVYPASDDIFNKFREEKDINPEDISETKETREKTGISRMIELSEGASGSDMDVPGSELDDSLEEVGSEDEENNYYSIGGDDHTDLDENKGN